MDITNVNATMDTVVMEQIALTAKIVIHHHLPAMQMPNAQTPMDVTHVHAKRNVNDGIGTQANFVEMLFRKNDTVILILLQNRVNLIND